MLLILISGYTFLASLKHSKMIFINYFLGIYEHDAFPIDMNEDNHFYSINLKIICGNVLSACVFSWIPLFVTTWTVACQAPLPMEFSRQEYWSGCYFLLQGIFPNQGLNLSLLNCRWSPTIAGGFFTTEPLGIAILWRLFLHKFKNIQAASHVHSIWQ